jgi:hypothetical protein
VDRGLGPRKASDVDDARHPRTRRFDRGNALLSRDDDNPYRPPDSTESDTGSGASDVLGPLDFGGALIGLNLVYYGIVGILLSMIAMVISVVLPVVAILALPGVIVAYLMMVIGPFFCLSVPVATGTRHLVAGSIVLQLLGVVVTIVGAVRTDMEIVAPLIGNLCSLLSAVLFVLFMRKLARCVGRTDLGASATRLLLLGMLLLVLTSSLVFYSFVAPQASGVLWIIPSILCLVVFVRYANPVNSMRLALRPGRVPMGY